MKQHRRSFTFIALTCLALVGLPATSPAAAKTRPGNAFVPIGSSQIADSNARSVSIELNLQNEQTQ